jgi:hypothetical protein
MDQTITDRATGYLHRQIERIDGKVTDLTGKSVGAWTDDVQRIVRDHPLQSAVVMLGLGYVLGKRAIRS